jgi:hypothetical protein
VAQLVFKSLEKDPEYRYQSVEEMINAWKSVTSNYIKQDERLRFADKGAS